MNGRINLERAAILLIDPTPLGLSVLGQIFAGFGASEIHKCTQRSEAEKLLLASEIDLVIVNDKLDLTDGYDFVKWLRRLQGNDNNFTSIILISGHTQRSLVSDARDCGANFVVAKPISPKVMLERIMWIAREKRPFLKAAHYVGPDRRFREAGDAENPNRRSEDVAMSPVELPLASGQ